MPPWYRPLPGGGWSLRIHAQPGARHTRLAGLHGDSLKVRIAAPALEDRANEALAVFLAQQLGVPRGAVALASGARSREKRFEVKVAVAEARLASLAAD